MAKVNSSEASKTRERKGGASRSKTGLIDRFKAWFLHHQLTAVESLGRLLSTPAQTLMTWLVVAIALILPLSLYLALANVQSLGAELEDSGQMSVFIHERAKPEAAQKLSEQLLTLSGVSSVELIMPDAALEEFQAYSGFGDIIESLDKNPLPMVLLVVPTLGQASAERLSALQAEIQTHAIVQDVSVDLEWVQRLDHILALAQRLVLALGILLVLGVVLVIGNTIRLAIENRRDEILIVKLVGGTNAFVRRPFLYTGIWYGVGGGVLAALILSAGLASLEAPIASLADLYQSNFVLQGLGFSGGVLLTLLAAFVGLLGAWLAVGRHLGQIEPR